MNVGLIAMSGKPVHAGHDALIRRAASENDIVNVYVSLADRDRPGEVMIRGNDMAKIWKTLIGPSMPDNVDISYVEQPVRSIYEFLGAASEKREIEDTYNVYSDPKDIAKNFPERSIKRYAPNLQDINLIPVTRASTVDVSGTKMRRFLQNNDKKSFMANLPQTINGEKYWSILHKARNESVLRSYISQLITEDHFRKTRS